MAEMCDNAGRLRRKITDKKLFSSIESFLGKNLSYVLIGPCAL